MNNGLDRKVLFRIFFLGVFLLLFFQLLHMISPFYTGILGAIVVTLIFYPLHHWIQKKVGHGRTNLAAALSTLLAVVLTVIPFICFSWLLLNEVSVVYPLIGRVSYALQSWRNGEGVMTDNAFLQLLEMRLRAFVELVNVDIESLVIMVISGVTRAVVNVSKALPRHALALLINVAVMVFTLFFLFRDGQTLFKRAKDLIPMDDKHKDNIARQLYLTLTAVVRGVFIVAITQGTLAGIGFGIAQVPSPVLLGAVTMLVALIPFVGAAVVWLPVAAIYFFHGATLKALFLFLWGALVVSLVDNFLRPILIGSKAKLPILFLFFGILGGIKVYGPMGLFFGPLVIALLMGFIRIYKEEYQSPSNSADTGRS